MALTDWDDDALVRHTAESRPDDIAPEGWPHAHIRAIARKLLEVEARLDAADDAEERRQEMDR